MDKELMEIMVSDWMADNADEMTDLNLVGSPYVNEGGVWCQDAEDTDHCYTLVADGGNIVICT